MFTEALLTIAKRWKQPKCPSTEEWIKKLWYIYTMEYCSAIKNNETMPFAVTQIDLGIIILSEQSQRKTNIICYHLSSLFIFGGSKITAVGDCSYEIKKLSLFGRKSYDKHRQHIKKQRHYFANKSLSS